MLNVSRLLQDEQILQDGFSASGSKVLFRPEQKNTSRLRDSLQKFAVLGDLIVDCCAGTILV